MMRLALSTIAVGLLTMGEASDVWLNELRLTARADSKLTAAVELVGHPPVYGASDDPTAAEKMEATVAFYGKDAPVACDPAVSTVELTAESGDWNGNYVADAECGSTVALLGGETVAGMTLTVDGDRTVYCWGEDATGTATIGGSITCQKILSATDLADDLDENSYSAVALFNKAAESDPGEGEGDYDWKVAKDSEGEAFHSIGKINVCTASTNGDCEALHDQSIARFVYGYPKQSTEGVWLNEIHVELLGTTYTTAIEVVGTPSATTDEEGPEKFDVKVQFYHGSTSEGSEYTIEMKNATSSDSAWNGHYSGKQESITDMDKVWQEAVGGLVMKWGEEEEEEATSSAVKEAVYCWGAEADEGKPVGTSTCQYVVKKGAFGERATASRGLYNKVGSPSAGGKNSADFYWADSRNGAVWYATIGKVNTCTGSDCERHEDQKLAEVVWEPSASAGSSLFTNGLRAQVFVVIALLVSVVRLV